MFGRIAIIDANYLQYGYKIRVLVRAWGGVVWCGLDGWWGWDGMGWDGMGWEGMGWEGMRWDEMLKRRR